MQNVFFLGLVSFFTDISTEMVYPLIPLYLVPGYLVFSLCYFGFAFAGNQLLMISAFVLFGIYAAMITGGERAFVAEISPKELCV